MKVVASSVVAVLLMAGVASAQGVRADEQDLIRTRQKMSTMEGVLERAVTNGADNLFRNVRAMLPLGDSPRLIGAPQVSGFRLDGFGLFFDVEVPELLMPPSWSLRYMVDQNGMAASAALAEFRALLPQVRDPQQRDRLARAVSRLELQIGPVGAPSPVAPGQQPQAQGRGAAVSAQSLAPAATPVGVMAQAAAPVATDPDVSYTREVQQALIDAMLENGSALPVAANEWLAVAARSSSAVDRLAVTGDGSGRRTIMLRIKGSDLAALRSGTITSEQARTRVEVHED